MSMMLAPPLPFLPREQFGKPVLGLVLVWVGRPGRGRAGDRPAAPARHADRRRRAPVPYVALQSMLDGGAPHGRHYYWKSHRLPALSDATIDVLHDAAGGDHLAVLADQRLGDRRRGQPRRARRDRGRRARGRLRAQLHRRLAARRPGRRAPPAWVREGWEALRADSAGVYANFISDEGAAGVEAAYGDRLERLTALKDRYDPTNVFRLQRQHPAERRRRRDDDVLVTGATGNVGSARGARAARARRAVRAFVRDAGRAADVLGDDVELAVGDFEDPASLRRALGGVDGVFLACGQRPGPGRARDARRSTRPRRRGSSGSSSCRRSAREVGSPLAVLGRARPDRAAPARSPACPPSCCGPRTT